METLARRSFALLAGGAVKNLIAIALLATALPASARLVRVWSEAEMQGASDLVVIGSVTSVRDLNEWNADLWPKFKFREVETTFTVSKILKGDFTNRTVVLHHYRFDPPNHVPPDGPSFLNLSPTDTNKFLLYLVKDGPTRFAPVSGQLDPALNAVRPMASDQDVIRHGVPRSALIITGNFVGMKAGGGGATSIVTVSNILKCPPDFKNPGQIAVYWHTTKPTFPQDTIVNTNLLLFFLRPKKQGDPTGYFDVTQPNHHFVRASEANVRLVESELKAQK